VEEQRSKLDSSRWDLQFYFTSCWDESLVYKCKQKQLQRRPKCMPFGGTALRVFQHINHSTNIFSGSIYLPHNNATDVLFRDNSPYISTLYLYSLKQT
jgi:hypothetical protein